MPDLDVSDVLSDPMFAETLTVIRRRQVIGSNGRATVTTKTYRPTGVVISQDDAPMLRGPDQQNLPRLLQVHTEFRLRGPSVDVDGVEHQPDIIVWNGDDYIVNKVGDFSKYGSGFIKADCSSLASTDHAPEAGERPE